jgi:nitrous oxidase accessory protein NosD
MVGEGGMRFGVHEMYTSDALVANNTVSDTMTAIIVMTRPEGNAIVGNHATDSDIGISVVGSTSYVADNVVTDNDFGISIASRRTLYERNTVVDNAVGLRSDTLLPTNWVTGNDVVDNARAVDPASGPTRIWTVEGRGNYWGELPATDRDGDGTYDRAYRPTGMVDAHVETAAGRTLARSPTVSLLRGFQSLVPGLRAGGVVDTDPRTEPAEPNRLRRLDRSVAV